MIGRIAVLALATVIVAAAEAKVKTEGRHQGLLTRRHALGQHHNRPAHHEYGLG